MREGLGLRRQLPGHRHPVGVGLVRRVPAPPGVPSVGTFLTMAHDDARDLGTAGPRRAVRTLVAVAAGLALAFSFEPYDLPVLLPVGVAGLVWSLHGTTARRGAWIGLLGGAAFMFVHLFWMRSVGYDAWLMLSTLETSFFAPLGAAVAVLTRLRAWPLWTAAAWVAVEQWRGGWPLGGMPWGRLAYGTMDTPFASATRFELP